ncbi:hypothetical protein [Streptomyces sp. NPDC057910]|uniref:hypothetical protein n=1 Tax=Streptomyces sp. NPDC057910 TaxID=3346278 RepID=UPI0036F00E74
MSEYEPQTAPQGPERQLVTPEGAQALRAYARRQRENAEALAAVLEDIATNGLPALEDCVPWDELRDAKLRELVAQRPSIA